MCLPWIILKPLHQGNEKINGTDCKVVKIFPLNDEENITDATLYIDEKQMVIMKSVISTKGEWNLRTGNEL